MFQIFKSTTTKFLNSKSIFQKKINFNFVKNFSLKKTNADLNPLRDRYLIIAKTGIATLLFGNLCFAGCAILYYENKRKTPFGSYQQKRFQFQKDFNQFWNGLPSTMKYLYTIIGVNVLVFLAWRVPKLLPGMSRYFLAGPFSKVVYSPMLLSAFSHHSFLHIAFNMMALYSFAPALHNLLGGEQFLAFYLTSAVIASFFSYFYKTVRIIPGVSLGASGAIIACLALFCLANPKSHLRLIIFPFIDFEAQYTIYVMMAIDMLGLFLGWKTFDHAAHLGGALFGIWYFHYGHKYLWKSQSKLIDKWHKYRSQK